MTRKTTAIASSPRQITEHVLADAERNYDPRLPYHNFAHALTVWSRAQECLAHLAAQHVAVDEQIVHYAILYHDAGYAEDHIALGHVSKEAYAAALATACLRSLRYPEEAIQRITQAILCTAKDGSCRTIEDYVVRAADLGGLAAAYPDFRHHSQQLWQEHCWLHHSKESWPCWIQMAVPQIRAFLITPMDMPGLLFDQGLDYPAFIARAEQNILQLADDHRGECKDDSAPQSYR